MDLLQNIYNSLLLDKQEKERVLEQIINKPTNLISQLDDAVSVLREIAVIVVSIGQFEMYMNPPANVPNPQGTVSQPQAQQQAPQQSISEDGLGVVQA